MEYYMKILRIDDVSNLTGLSKSSIYKQIRQNQFPQSIKLTARATGWDSREVEKWITNKINQKLVNVKDKALLPLHEVGNSEVSSEDLS